MKKSNIVPLNKRMTYIEALHDHIGKLTEEQANLVVDNMIICSSSSGDPMFSLVLSQSNMLLIMGLLEVIKQFILVEGLEFSEIEV